MVGKSERSDNLIRPRDFIDILGTDWPFRPITVITVLIITFLPTTASELSRLANPSLLAAVGVATLSVTVLGTLLFLVGIVFPARWRRSLPLIIATLMAVGAARGFLVSTFVSASGIEAHPHLVSRVVLAAISLPPVLSLVSIVVSRVVDARTRSLTTRTDIAETERTRERFLREVRESDARLIAEIDEVLRPAIVDISRDVRRGKTTRSELADSLDRLADGIIRPLSHTLATAPSEFSTPRPPIALSVDAPGTPTIREQLSPAYSGLGVLLGSGTVLVDLVPVVPAFVAALIAGLSVFIAVQGVVAIIGRRRWAFLPAVLLVMAVHAVVWIPGHLINMAVIFPPAMSFQPWAVSFVAMPVLGLLYLLIIRGAYSSRNNLLRLENTRLNVVLQMSEARRRTWLHQRHLTHTLHSTIQSRVHAEARLVREGAGSLSSLEQNRIIATVTSVLSSVTEGPPHSIDAVKGINDMIAFWSGMCDISLTVDSDVLDAANGDADVAEAIQIVTLEMISNAIRHGDAKSITITMKRNTPDTIRIVAVNNGRSVDSSQAPGLGSRLYDELTAEWTISNGTPVTVRAVIAARGNTLES